MPPPRQKADVRPISFILHNQITGEFAMMTLPIRPEDLSRTDVSRLTVHQTIGGAWADNFGPGLPTVNISGTTGWGQGWRLDGLQAFINLHELIFVEWHRMRADAVENAQDPELVKLIFDDGLDEFTWVVAPQTFVLKRNRHRPLLSQYQINLTYLSGDVADSMWLAAEAMESLSSVSSFGELSQLDSILNDIDDFADTLVSGIDEIVGPVQDAIAGITTLTAKALTTVQSVLGSAMKVVDAVAVPAMVSAINLSRAAANVVWTTQSVVSFVPSISAKFSTVASALNNANVLLSTALKPKPFVPTYNTMFAAKPGTVSGGGMAVSPRVTTSKPLGALLPVTAPPVTSTGAATVSLNNLVSLDPVLNTVPFDTVIADAQTVVDGTSFSSLEYT